MHTMQGMFERMINSWGARDKWVTPVVSKSLLFLASEVGEAADAFLRSPGGDDGFNRNNPEEQSGDEFANELADTVFMAYVTAIAAGINLDAAIVKKLAEMDVKRGGDSLSATRSPKQIEILRITDDDGYTLGVVSGKIDYSGVPNDIMHVAEKVLETPTVVISHNGKTQ